MPATPCRLYDFLPCSPRNLAEDRGLDLTILSGGYSAYLSDHEDRKTVAATVGVTLGTFLHNPWGRGPGYLQLPNGDYTSMFLDQIDQAWDAGYTGLTDGILSNTTPSSTILYIGSVPDGTLLDVKGVGVPDPADKTYADFVNAGYGFAFDALTTYNGVGTLHDYAKGLHDAGDHYILAEANRYDNGIPLLATHDLWSNPSRIQPENAPSNSAYWWRSSSLDGPFDMDRAASYYNAGLNLIIRLNQLTATQRGQLYELVAATTQGYVPPKSVTRVASPFTRHNWTKGYRGFR